MSAQTHTAREFAFLVCIIFLITCAPKLENAGYPLESLETYPVTHEARILLAPGVKMEAVVDLRAFAGVAPGASLEETKKVLGKPDIVRIDQEGTHLVFLKKGHMVSLVKMEELSSIDERRIPRWELRAWVEEDATAVIPIVLRQLLGRLDSRIRRVILSSNTGPEAGITLNIRNGRVIYLSTPVRESPGQRP
jgi:hypothetical protein